MLQQATYQIFAGLQTWSELKKKMTSRFNLNLDPLSPELKEKAAKELRETPDVVPGALSQLRQLLAMDDKIYFKTDDDKVLIMYLRPCKFYAKSAYELVRNLSFALDLNTKEFQSLSKIEHFTDYS